MANLLHRKMPHVAVYLTCGAVSNSSSGTIWWISYHSFDFMTFRDRFPSRDIVVDTMEAGTSSQSIRAPEIEHVCGFAQSLGESSPSVPFTEFYDGWPSNNKLIVFFGAEDIGASISAILFILFHRGNSYALLKIPNSMTDTSFSFEWFVYSALVSNDFNAIVVAA